MIPMRTIYTCILSALSVHSTLRHGTHKKIKEDLGLTSKEMETKIMQMLKRYRSRYLVKPCLINSLRTRWINFKFNPRSMTANRPFSTRSHTLLMAIHVGLIWSLAGIQMMKTEILMMPMRPVTVHFSFRTLRPSYMIRAMRLMMICIRHCICIPHKEQRVLRVSPWYFLFVLFFWAGYKEEVVDNSSLGLCPRDREGGAVRRVGEEYSQDGKRKKQRMGRTCITQRHTLDTPKS